MRRRDLLLGLSSGTVLRPLGVVAQDKRRPRLAFFVPVFPEAVLSETGGGDPMSIYGAMFQELRRRGYEEGRTLDVGRWSARGNPARYPDIAHEIVGSQPDVIYAVDTGPVQALVALTSTIPIIAHNVSLVDSRLAESFSRPGRNVTGFSPAWDPYQLAMKRLQLLREALPTASRIALITRRIFWDSDFSRRFREEASRIGVAMVGALLDDPIGPEEYRRIFAAMRDQRIDAVWAADFSANAVHRHLIIDLAIEGRLPVMTAQRDATERGGLISYGLDITGVGRIAADMIVRVLRGEKPADMPLRSLDKFELVINLKTARALGRTIPPAVIAIAHEVID